VTATFTACGCYACVDDPAKGIANPALSRFIVCPECGNKRCPRGTDHRLDCTGSNEPGQPGSRFAAVPRESER